MQRRLLAAITGVLVALSLQASAAAQVADGVGSGVTSFGTGEWFGLVLRLALVLGVIWAAVLGMRWYVRRMTGQAGPRAGGRALEVIETRTLAPNRSLHLVRLGDRAVLIGVTPERITSLLAVDDPDEVQGFLDQPEGSGRRPLASMLAGLGAMTSRTPAGARPRARQAMGLMDLLRGAAGRRRTARPAAAPSASAAPAPRQSLFDRTLAATRPQAPSVPMGEPASALALRARSGYQAASSMSDVARPATRKPSERDAQIAEAQRAIAAMRRNAG